MHAYIYSTDYSFHDLILQILWGKTYTLACMARNQPCSQCKEVSLNLRVMRDQVFTKCANGCGRVKSDLHHACNISKNHESTYSIAVYMSCVVVLHFEHGILVYVHVQLTISFAT